MKSQSESPYIKRELEIFPRTTSYVKGEVISKFFQVGSYIGKQYESKMKKYVEIMKRYEGNMKKYALL